MVATLPFTGGNHMISVQQTHTLYKIQNVLKDDEGMYKCIADSPHSSARVGTIYSISQI